MKILAVGSELSHADRQTDMTELTVAFSKILQMRLKMVVSFTQIAASFHPKTSNLLQNLKII